jgi:hypothetical protein
MIQLIMKMGPWSILRAKRGIRSEADKNGGKIKGK